MGYTGTLCAQCASPGYGSRSAGECTKCPSRGLNTLYYILSYLLTIALLTWTIRATLSRSLGEDRAALAARKAEMGTGTGVGGGSRQGTDTGMVQQGRAGSVSKGDRSRSRSGKGVRGVAGAGADGVASGGSVLELAATQALQHIEAGGRRGRGSVRSSVDGDVSDGSDGEGPGRGPGGGQVPLPQDAYGVTASYGSSTAPLPPAVLPGMGTHTAGNPRVPRSVRARESRLAQQGPAQGPGQGQGQQQPADKSLSDGSGSEEEGEGPGEEGRPLPAAAGSRHRLARASVAPTGGPRAVAEGAERGGEDSLGWEVVPVSAVTAAATRPGEGEVGGHRVGPLLRHRRPGVVQVVANGGPVAEGAEGAAGAGTGPHGRQQAGRKGSEDEWEMTSVEEWEEEGEEADGAKQGPGVRRGGWLVGGEGARSRRGGGEAAERLRWAVGQVRRMRRRMQRRLKEDELGREEKPPHTIVLKILVRACVTCGLLSVRRCFRAGTARKQQHLQTVWLRASLSQMLHCLPPPRRSTTSRSPAWPAS